MRKPTAILLLLLLAVFSAGLWVFLQEGSAADPFTEETVSATTELAGTEQATPTGGTEAVKRESLPEVMEEKLSLAPAGIPLLFLKSTGGPAADVSVIPWIGKEMKEIVSTDENGEVTLAPYRGLGGLAIYPKNRMPLYLEFEFSDEAIVVIIEEGHRLAGKLNFQKPRRLPGPVYLRNYSGQGYPSLVPRSVQRELGAKAYSAKLSHVEVEADGSFEWTGLPYDWSGTVTIGSGYLLCACSPPGEIDPSGDLKLSGLTENLQIEVTELPFFHGRVVTPDGAQGVAGIQLIGVSYTTEVRVNGAMVFAETKEDGSFEMPIAAMDRKTRKEFYANVEGVLPFDLDLEIRGNEQWGGVSMHLKRKGHEDPWDLGDIHLVGLNVLDFRIVDENGIPIEGALAYSESMSEPTDENGVGVVRFGPEAESIAFGAKGYSSTSLVIAEMQDGLLEVELVEAASVFIHWNVPEGANLLGLKIELKGEEGIFEEDGMNFGPDRRFRKELGIKSVGGGGRRGIFQSTSWPLKNTQSELELWGLRPNVPLTFFLSDLMASVLDEEELTLKQGEHRDIAFVLPFAPKVFVGRVVDENGVSIANAKLMMSSKSNYRMGRSTDVNGEFSYEGIASETVNLNVKKEGYTQFYDSEFEVPPAGVQASVVLEKARNLVVYLQTPSGMIQPHGYYELPGGSLGPQKSTKERGTLLSAAPTDSFRLYWMKGGAFGEVTIPADVLEYTIDVPEMASTVLEVSRSAVAMDQYYRVALIPQGFSVGYDENRFEKDFYLGEGVSADAWALAALLPGSYMVQFLKWIPNTEGTGEYRIQSETGPIELVVGENPRIHFAD
ncbi:MAG: carboxypeptidase-like regulatory domain-containing protein [Planctomycetota bacterium]